MPDSPQPPIVVTDGFSPEQMQKLVELVRAADGLPRGVVFGMVTSNNRRWRLSALLEELRREEKQVTRPPR